MATKPRVSLLLTKVTECQPPVRKRRQTSPNDVRHAARSQLTDDQLVYIRDVFTLFDERDVGHMKQREMRLAMQTLGIQATENEILLMMEWVGIRVGESISFDDFLVIMFSLFQDHRIEDQLREIFDLFDTSSDGYLSAKELQAALVRYGKLTMSDVEIYAILEDCSTDPSGQFISFENFVNYMCCCNA
eukprot:GGOE01054643.1.p2 GENE.GGOE01054643.1~~GGOE01054643.1.p2  ORF type:complete len:189 (-),score=54.58 GGOE01054643.1:856-1422(-)